MYLGKVYFVTKESKRILDLIKEKNEINEIIKKISIEYKTDHKSIKDGILKFVEFLKTKEIVLGEV